MKYEYYMGPGLAGEHVYKLVNNDVLFCMIDGVWHLWDGNVARDDMHRHYGVLVPITKEEAFLRLL